MLIARARLDEPAEAVEAAARPLEVVEGEEHLGVVSEDKRVREGERG